MHAKTRDTSGGGLLFTEWRANTWQDAVCMADMMHGWVFRGQANAKWGLSSSLERIGKGPIGRRLAPPEREEEIIDRFKRQAHQFIPHLPDDNANLEWLSLIQHHGGPTRLLDVTKSFYVAAFFAVEPSESDAVVWAVNRHLLDHQFMMVADSDAEARQKTSIQKTVARVAEHCIRSSLPSTRNQSETGADVGEHPYMKCPNMLVVEPWRMNQRIIIQQGLFLFPTSVCATFEQNLAHALKRKDGKLPTRNLDRDAIQTRHLLQDGSAQLALVKIILKYRQHHEILRDLHKMNITAATLFPGLDGFAKSLRFSLRLFDELWEERQ